MEREQGVASRHLKNLKWTLLFEQAKPLWGISLWFSSWELYNLGMGRGVGGENRDFTAFGSPSPQAKPHLVASHSWVLGGIVVKDTLWHQTAQLQDWLCMLGPKASYKLREITLTFLGCRVDNYMPCRWKALNKAWTLYNMTWVIEHDSELDPHVQCGLRPILSWGTSARSQEPWMLTTRVAVCWLGYTLNCGHTVISGTSLLNPDPASSGVSFYVSMLTEPF